jgi:hypothetical protein
VFGWVEGGGEEGWVDVACCAGGGVCLGGKSSHVFHFDGPLEQEKAMWILRSAFATFLGI